LNQSPTYATLLQIVLRELLLKIHAIDGCEHPAESFVEELLRQYPKRGPLTLSFLATSSRCRWALLYCLSRIDPALLGPWLLPIVRQGLQDRRSDVRELAVELSDYVGRESIVALRDAAGREPEQWLIEYMNLVVAELRAA
jgi:hypothetical protein